MESLYAEIGRLNMMVKQKDAAFRELVSFAARMVTGEIELSRVMVNLTDGIVSCCERGHTPALPMQFNGLPEVAVQVAPSETDKLKERIRQLEADLLIASTGGQPGECDRAPEAPQG